MVSSEFKTFACFQIIDVGKCRSWTDYLIHIKSENFVLGVLQTVMQVTILPCALDLKNEISIYTDWDLQADQRGITNGLI